MVELTEVLFPLSVADKNMFELLKDSFSLLDQGERNDALRIHFEARAMTLPSSLVMRKPRKPVTDA